MFSIAGDPGHDFKHEFGRYQMLNQDVSKKKTVNISWRWQWARRWGRGVYDIFWTIWMGIPCRTKSKSKLGYKAIYNNAMPYLMVLMITGLKFSENPENEQINLWPERNLIVLDKMMMNVWNKWAIDLGRKESQWDKNVANRPIKFEAQQVSIRLYQPFLRSRR